MPPTQAQTEEKELTKKERDAYFVAENMRRKYVAASRLRLKNLQDTCALLDAGFDARTWLQTLQENTRDLARMTTPRADLYAAEAALEAAQTANIDYVIALLNLGLLFLVGCGCSLALGRAFASPSEIFTTASLFFAEFFGVAAVLCGCRAGFKRMQRGPYVPLVDERPRRAARDEAQKKYDDACNVRFKELCAENEVWLKLKRREMAAVRSCASKSNDAVVADVVAVDLLMADCDDIRDESKFV